MEQIKEELESNKDKNNSESNFDDKEKEKEEFDKEIIGRRKIDILKYYREFSYMKWNNK